MNRKQKDFLLALFFIGLFAVLLSETKIFIQKNSAGLSFQTRESEGASAGIQGQDRPGGEGKSQGQGNTSSSKPQLMTDAFNKIKEQFTTPTAPTPGAQKMKARTTDFFDKDGNFKSYYEEGIPEEFLSDRNYYTTPDKMQRDIERRLEKLQYDMEMEEEVFVSTFGREGKYEEEYNKLRALHRKVSRETYEQNMKALKEFRLEIERENEKGLR